MINAWLRNCSFVVFMKKEIKYTKRERERETGRKVLGD